VLGNALGVIVRATLPSGISQSAICSTISANKGCTWANLVGPGISGCPMVPRNLSACRGRTVRRDQAAPATPPMPCIPPRKDTGTDWSVGSRGYATTAERGNPVTDETGQTAAPSCRACPAGVRQNCDQANFAAKGPPSHPFAHGRPFFQAELRPNPTASPIPSINPFSGSLEPRTRSGRMRS
jgi:hypothetical protein